MPHAAPTHRAPQADAPTHAGPALRARMAAEQARGTASSRGYGATWRRLRALVLSMEPTCRTCRARGAVVAATDVDHVVPRRAGGADRLDNLQPLCGACHRAKTVAETLRGRRREPSEPPMAATGRHPLAGIPEPAGGGGGGIPGGTKQGTTPPSGAHTPTGFGSRKGA